MSKLVSQLKIRYSKALYLGYGKSAYYHFFYGFKRNLIELTKSFIYLISSIFELFSLVKVKEQNEISIYETYNQKVSLENAKSIGLTDVSPIKGHNLSLGYSFFRFVVWFIRFLIYPFIFLAKKNKEGAYLLYWPASLEFYNRFLLNAIIKYSDTLNVANDHSGDVYIITIMAREHDQLKVNYFQHGAVKPEFPSNYFDNLYLYDESYRVVYEVLSKKQNRKIIVEPRLREGKSQIAESIDCLVILSHQFPIFSIIRSIKKVKGIGFKVVYVRFHPSDRLRFIKAVLLNIFTRVSNSDTKLGIRGDIMRSDVVLSASSSVLLDAYTNRLTGSLIWVKSLGLKWDYYKLENKINVAESVSDIPYLIEKINMAKLD